MKTTIENLSNERLEQEIADVYMTAHREGISVRGSEGSLLQMMWEEFDERFAAGTIDRDTEWTERQVWE